MSVSSRSFSGLSLELSTMFEEIDKLSGEDASSLSRVSAMLHLTSERQIDVRTRDLEHEIFTELTEGLLEETNNF